MLRRVAFPLVLGCALAGLPSCGSFFSFEEREPWRAQVEAQCLASGEVNESAGIRIANPIEGPGTCGLDHPFKVSALDMGAMGSQFAALRARQAPAAAPVDGEGGLTPLNDVTGQIAPPADIGAAQQSLAPVNLRDGGPFAVSMDRGLVLSCSMIPTLTRWLASDVQPAALAAFGSPVVEMTTFGSYSCRRRDNRSTGRMSEHAYANAVDVKGFKLADGRETKVLTGWRGASDEQAFWRDVAYGACRTFTTVLGPGTSDGMHENHLHLDLARHSAQRLVHVCRPRVPSGWVSMAQRGLNSGGDNNNGSDPQFTGSIVDPLKGEDDE